MAPSAAALLAAANDWLTPLVGDARQILLVSHHQTKPGGLPFGLVISRSTIDPGTAWAILAVAQRGSWEVCEVSSLALDDEDPSERVWGLSPYELSDEWLAYGKESTTGALVAFNRNREGVAAIRSRHAPPDSLWVGPDLLLSLSWDVEKPDSESWGKYWARPREIELRLGRSSAWEPAAELRAEIVSQRLFVETCRRYPRTKKPEDYWAWDDLGQWDQRDKLALVRTVIEAATLDEDDLLGRLGAGPLEDMDPGFLLDEIGQDGLADRRWLTALASDRDFEEPGPHAERLHRMLTPESRHWLMAARAKCGTITKG